VPVLDAWSAVGAAEWAGDGAAGAATGCWKTGVKYRVIEAHVNK